MKKNATLIIAGIPIITTVFAGAILTSSIVSADDSVVDNINITVPVSCSMSGTGMNSHNANITNGIYQANIGTTTLHAFCNDSEGFAIYAAGYTGDEIGATNSNKLVGTSASGNAVIDTGLATTTGNPDVSNWAMKLAITQDSGDTTGTNAYTIDSAPNVALPSQAESGATQASFSNYHVVPNEYVKVAHKNSATDMTANTGGVKLTTTYAAYISKTQPADTYSGQVIYTLVYPASHVAPGALIPPSSCTTLVPGLKYMQDLTNSNKATILSNMTEDSQYYLADKRDDKTYCVAKLKDGNIWMTQNLDLDLDSNTTYTNEDTDIGWNGSSYSTASWKPLRATYVTDDNTWEGSFTEPESYDPGEIYWNGNVVVPQGQNQTSVSGDSHYHLGNYYNWTAAVAMNNSSSYTTDDTDANRSICPANWTLPKSGNNTSSGSFQYIFEQYGWDINTYSITNPYVWDRPIKLALSGDKSLALDHIGYFGVLWSSVVSGYGSAYAANVYYDVEIEPKDNYTYNSGLSVRCVAR